MSQTSDRADVLIKSIPPKKNSPTKAVTENSHSENQANMADMDDKNEQPDAVNDDSSDDDRANMDANDDDKDEPEEADEPETAKGEKTGNVARYTTRHDGLYRSFQQTIGRDGFASSSLYLGALSRLENHSESDFPKRFVKSYWNKYVKKHPERVRMMRQDAEDSRIVEDGTLKRFNSDVVLPGVNNRKQLFNIIHPMNQAELKSYCEKNNIIVPKAKRVVVTKYSNDIGENKDNNDDGDKDDGSDNDDGAKSQKNKKRAAKAGKDSQSAKKTKVAK